MVYEHKISTCNDSYGIEVKSSNSYSKGAFWSTVLMWRHGREVLGSAAKKPLQPGRWQSNYLIKTNRKFYTDMFQHSKKGMLWRLRDSNQCGTPETTIFTAINPSPSSHDTSGTKLSVSCFWKYNLEVGQCDTVKHLLKFQTLLSVLMSMWLASEKCVDVEKIALFLTSKQDFRINLCFLIK